jgi:FkbM family methyltransferase
MPNIVTRYGVLEAFDPDTDLICRVLTKYGEWAQHELRFVASAIHDGARVADVGAFLGTFSLGLAQLRRLESVCLVEANQATVPALRANVERNLPAKGVVVEAVVGQAGREYSGTVIPENAGSFSLAFADGDGRVAASSVQATKSLAELDREHGPFDLIKLDTEGMEYEILSSSLDYLASTRAAFWVECNEAPSSLRVAELFLSQGFQLLYFAFPALSPDNFNQEREIDYPFGYESGMWATRGQAPTLSPELEAAGCTLTTVRSVDELRDAMWLTPRWAPKDWLFHTQEEMTNQVISRT